jgi:flagellar basal-body rod protein FlgB
LTSDLDFHAQALVLRAERQRIIASNIANADTPGYAARDINFRQAMSDALASNSGTTLGGSRPSVQASTSDGTTNPRHIALSSGNMGSANASPTLVYTTQTQPSIDGNSVDLDRERANFVDNAVRFEATLRFINGQSKTILSAIQGQ